MPVAPVLPPAPPRMIAISGIIFSLLFIVCLVLIRLAVPADPNDLGTWLADPVFRNWVHIALNLVPFTGIAFLWFMAVLRNRIGLLEDRFFATVFLGSGLLFVAMLFAAAAVSRGLLDTFGASASLPAESEAFRNGRGMAYALLGLHLDPPALHRAAPPLTVGTSDRLASQDAFGANLRLVGRHGGQDVAISRPAGVLRSTTGGAGLQSRGPSGVHRPAPTPYAQARRRQRR